jgi:CRISPR/Cas system CSM-associated protein Csm3 (group 7 of RAMP superfamily)
MATTTYEVNNFKKLFGFARIDFDLEAKSPILIKGAEDELSEKNLARFIRLKKASGEIACIIPGSTIKGFIRGTLERLKTAVPDIENIAKERFGYVNERNLQRKNNASTIFFDDFEAIDPEFDLRPMIKIDPATMSVERGAMLTLECIREGTIFKGGMTIRNWDLDIFGYLKTVIDLANNQLVSIGSNKSRGFGHIEFKNPSITLNIIGKNTSNPHIKFDEKNNKIMIEKKEIQLPTTAKIDTSDPIITKITIQAKDAENFMEICKKLITQK